MEFSLLNGFSNSLDSKNERRHLLFKYFQGLLDAGCNVCSLLCSYFSVEINLLKLNGIKLSENVLELGLLLSEFFIDGHWFESGKAILESCLSLNESDENISPYFFNFYVKLLHIFNKTHDFKNGEELVEKLRRLIEEQNLKQSNAYNTSEAYLKISEYSYIRFGINEDARFLCGKAFNSITKTNFFTRIEILSHLAKDAFLWEERLKAKSFIVMAMQEIRNEFKIGKQIFPISHSALHPKIIRLFIDYAFFLKADQKSEALLNYQTALKIAMNVFDENDAKEIRNNLLIAEIFIEMADCYMNEKSANECIENGMKIIEKIYTEDHVEKALSKMDKVEIVFKFVKQKTITKQVKHRLLKQYEKLLLACLDILQSKYGGFKTNYMVKCYSMLGHVYDELNDMDKAQQMFSEAFRFSLDLNGWNCLSAKHCFNLADFCKDSEKFKEAEELYLLCIPVFVQSYGESYELLEYINSQLISIYRHFNDEKKMKEYELKLRRRRNDSLKDDDLNELCKRQRSS
ncbi:amyloid protein-binding protein 2-like protein [Dinothrombium tinctorium]|uniref:Amyloid protein-binding protein 2-like protein n=1 Tax=Dinothrombium tinctorium TaxID=1965070 RepID=A0A3S3Q3C0_9ACAR|nr:amyloid protein-binding protein 2-like protein [Dinothrombium tinctorium]RWS13171.1 amyloid protein-binding protein 2-like protein [Dinothrombium tinctorium]